jgi:hypothetical protein
MFGEHQAAGSAAEICPDLNANPSGTSAANFLGAIAAEIERRAG